MPKIHTVTQDHVFRVVFEKIDPQDVAGIDFVDEQGRVRTRIELGAISTGESVTVTEPGSRVPPTSSAQQYKLGLRSDLGEGQPALATMPGPGRSPHWRGYRYLDRPQTDDQVMIEVLNHAYRMRNHADFTCFGGTQVIQDVIGPNASTTVTIEHGGMSNLARFRAELGIRRNSDHRCEYFTVWGGGRVTDSQTVKGVTSDGVIGGAVGLSASNFVVANVSGTLTLTISNPLSVLIAVGGFVSFGGC